VPSSELVLVVLDEVTPASPLVVVVVDSFVVCAKAVLNAATLTAPIANIFINGVCFIFVLLFG
jgi:hypothetical protein